MRYAKKAVCTLLVLLLSGCAAGQNVVETTVQENKETGQKGSAGSENVRTLTGTISEPVIIDTSEKVTLTLEDAQLETIEIRHAQSATIILKGTNTIKETTIGTPKQEDANAAIYADCPLLFEGDGSLEIDASSNHAIYSKDTIEIDSGIYTIASANDGIKGKDGVMICGGEIDIDSGDHGIASTKNKDGEYGSITINGGTVGIDAQGDGIHCTGGVTIGGKELTIRSDQEGIEGQTVSISDGINTIAAADDGINASDPNISNEDTDPFANRSGTCSITISGGQNTIVADGDGLDSNGSLTVSGGTTIVCGPENGGDFALDFNSTGTFEGGMLIAAGMSGMMQTLSGDTPFIVMGTNQPAGTGLTVEQNGHAVCSLTAEHAFNTLLVYDSGFQTGDEISILNETLTLSQGQNTIGSVMNRGGMPGQPGRGMEPDGRFRP